MNEITKSPSMVKLNMVSGNPNDNVCLSFMVDGVQHHLVYNIRKSDKKYADRLFSAMIDKQNADHRAGIDIHSSEYLSDFEECKENKSIIQEAFEDALSYLTGEPLDIYTWIDKAKKKREK